MAPVSIAYWPFGIEPTGLVSLAGEKGGNELRCAC
jgi:hypothetical protein